MAKLLAAPALTTTVVEVAPARLPPANWMVILVATVWDRLVKVARPFTAVWVVAPCKVPLPALRLAVTAVLLSELTRLPKPSSMRTTGCCPKATPAVAAAEGCVWMVKRLAEPALTAIEPEVTPLKPLLLKPIVILVATLCDRLVKLTTPLAAVRLVVPCNVPLPALRLAVSTVELSALRTLPYWSSIRTSGCWAKGDPAIAVHASY